MLIDVEIDGVLVPKTERRFDVEAKAVILDDLAMPEPGAQITIRYGSLAAFQYAIDVGADVLDLDVGFSKDDRLVVVHDQRISAQLCLGPNGEKLSDPGPPIRSLT